ncbi:MAG: hypothetical protein ACR2OD_10285 [Gaiellaceae bacterium]
MKLREFLDHRVPMREIIVGHYPSFKRLALAGEPNGVLVRHRWVVNYSPDMRFYEGDISYPPRPDSIDSHVEGNAQSVPPTFQRLFVVNSRSTDPRVTAIPVGVYSNSRAWRFALARIGTSRRELAYCNFSIGAAFQPWYMKKRLRVYSDLRRRDWITFESMGTGHGEHDLGRLAYYRRVGEHRFTISPEGNGADCHRTWEALYLKSIPIVQRSREMAHFEDLPILFTDDYSELTPEYLDEQYERMLETDYAIEKLYLSHWRDELKAEVARHRP